MIFIEGMAIFFPQLINRLSKKLVPELFLAILLGSQSFVDGNDASFAVILVEPIQEVAGVLISSVPVALGRLLPMRRHEATPQANIVGNALDQAAGSSAEGVPLPTVDHFVADDAEHLVPAALFFDALDVIQGKVDFLVVRVEVKARGVGDSTHGAEHEGDGAHGRDDGVRRVEPV